MTGVHNVLNGTQPDAMGGIGADGLFHFALEISPPDDVETISRYLGSSVGQGGRDDVSNCPAEAVSDSGDSLFLTQKEATSPEVVRSARLRRYSRRSTPISPRDLEESEGGSSSTSHTGELKTPKWKRRKKYPLPKFSFPFLKEQEWKFRSTPFPDHNQSLHDYTIGGFFKCLGELRQSSQRGQDLESSLPTVDMDGEYISPLSEEDGERSEDEDIKVVERNHFLASSKKTSQKTWCNQLKRQKRRKDNNAGRETSGRRETEISHIQRAGSGGSSCRVLVQRAREASEPVAGQAGDGPGSQRLLHGLPDHSSVTEVRQRTKEWSEGLSAETSVNVTGEETPSLSEGYRAAQTSSVLGLNGTNAIRDSSGNDNALRRVEGDIPDFKQSKKSAAGSVGQEVDGNLECDVRVEDSVSSVSCDMEDGGRKRRKGSGEDAEQLQSGAVAEPRSDDAEILKKRRKGSGEDAEQLQSGAVAEPRSDDAEIKKKKMKKKRRKGSGEDAEQLQSGAVAEPRSDDAEILKKRRRKGNGEDAEQLQSGAVVEPRSDDAEIKKKKKKKKRRKDNGEDAEQLQSATVVEPRSDDAEIKKKKKKKKELGILITEEASNRTLDLPPVSTEQLEAPGNCLENAAASQLPLGPSLVKRKKCKKKQQFSNDATQDGEESVDLSFCLDDSVTSAKGSGVSLKKKRKSMYVSYAPKRKFENVSNQKTNEGLEDQNAELVTKKKKKNSEMFSRGVSEDKVAQSDDSVSAREKEKKRHSSFLIADAEESDVQTHGERISPSPSRVGAGDVEELNDGVTKRKKKKRKSKTSVTQDRASALLESAAAGRKKKKERTGSESEGLDSAADTGFSANYEAVVLKKKKKKKCNDVIIEGPPTATTCSSVSRKKKGKCDVSTETLTSVEHDLASSETLNDTRVQKKKKKKLKNEGKSLTESAESEPRETKKKQKKERSEQPPVPSPVTPETPHILRKKHRKLKRKLLNPNEDFFTDS